MPVLTIDVSHKVTATPALRCPKHRGRQRAKPDPRHEFPGCRCLIDKTVSHYRLGSLSSPKYAATARMFPYGVCGLFLRFEIDCGRTPDVRPVRHFKANDMAMNAGDESPAD